MDNLAEYFISDEEEPQPKTRKTRKVTKSRAITKSNFAQVKNINIYEKDYQKWIRKFNSKISDHFPKVRNFFK